MAKKTEFIGVRVSKELRASLEKKAEEQGISLSRFVEEGLHDTYRSDKEIMLNLIAKRKQERPEYWKELEKSDPKTPNINLLYSFIGSNIF